jgi:protein O-mannosyl-transferase
MSLMTASRPTPRHSQRIARNPAIVLATALVAIVLLSYAPTYSAGFIWDDADYVLNNQTLRTLHGVWEMWTMPTSLPQWYPLVHTTFWLEYHLWGVNPLGYHIVNVCCRLAARFCCGDCW